MTVHSRNRYAVFDNEEDAPASTPGPVDDSYKAFINQVAEDSGPWQQVTKRGQTQIQQAPTQTIRTLVIRPAANSKGAMEARTRAASDSTTASMGYSYNGYSSNNSDKSFNAYENWCGVCSQKFPSKAAMQSHVKYTPNHDHYCNLCKRCFKDRNGIKNHVENAAGHGVFCNMCLSAFKDENGLRDHFRHNKHGIHEFSCLGCLIGYSNAQKLDHHMKTHRRHAWDGKVVTASIPCWGCDALLPSLSALINHLESSRCPSLPDPSRITGVLGKWWYSPLYMDLDLHAQIRTGRISLLELQQWMNDGFVQPFLCRGGCEKKFNHLSSLVLHCESQACEWDVTRLNLPGLKKELALRSRNDSMYSASE